jgi:xanthine/uracil permease
VPLPCCPVAVGSAMTAPVSEVLSSVDRSASLLRVPPFTYPVESGEPSALLRLIASMMVTIAPTAASIIANPSSIFARSSLDRDGERRTARPKSCA